MSEKSKGLGDTIAKLTKATGIDKVAENVAKVMGKEDCGCNKRKEALNKAFLKVKVSRSDIEKFKANLINLLEHINDKESEEFHKNLMAAFLKNTY